MRSHLTKTIPRKMQLFATNTKHSHRNRWYYNKRLEKWLQPIINGLQTRGYKDNICSEKQAVKVLSTHLLVTFWMVHCSRRMHESLTSGGAMSMAADLSWPCLQLANSSTSIHIGTRLRHNVCICFCIRAALSHCKNTHKDQYFIHTLQENSNKLQAL